MTALPALSLHQPWATLCVTPVPCGIDRCVTPHMVKRYETRSRPCPPKYIGQRIAIHAGKTWRWCRLGDWYIERWWDSVRHVAECECDGEEIEPVCARRSAARPTLRHLRQLDLSPLALPLGAVVATAIVTASLPIVSGWKSSEDWVHPCVLHDEDGLDQYDALLLNKRSLTDQLPYGDWTPSRFAWELSDVRPLSEPVPAKGRQGWWRLDEATTAEVIRCGG